MSEFERVRDLASLFSAKAIKTLVSTGASGLHCYHAGHRELSDLNHDSSVEGFFQSAYGKLLSSYRNEYVYKNAIAEKIIRGRHRFSRNCYFASEFRVVNSIADVVIANGTTTAYEIKTEYDSFERLSGQLNDYSRVFDHINVVIPEKSVGCWISRVPDYAGVIALTEQYTLKTFREPQSNKDNLDHQSVFSCFRREEYIAAIRNQFGYLPHCKPVELKQVCRELFLKLDKAAVHDEFLKALRARTMREEKLNLIKKAPSSLTSILLSVNLTLREVAALEQVFEEVY